MEELIFQVNKKGFICHKCHKALKKVRIHVKAVSNNLKISFVPKILLNLIRLERILISRRILFKKIAIMSKEQFPKLKGSICNIPVNTLGITNVLPHSADSNGLVVDKIKMKVELPWACVF